MSDIIGAPVRLRDALRRPDARGREVETAMAMHLEPFMVRNNLTVHDMLRACMGNVVAIVLAKSTDHADAIDGMRQITAEMMRRVTDH